MIYEFCFVTMLLYEVKSLLGCAHNIKIILNSSLNINKVLVAKADTKYDKNT